VVPLRWDHQKAGEAEVSPWGDGGGLASTSPEILATGPIGSGLITKKSHLKELNVFSDSCTEVEPLE
jgi:hypothetical protein